MEPRVLIPRFRSYEIAEAVGYRIVFLILGAFALGSLLLWLIFAKLVKSAAAEAKA